MIRIYTIPRVLSMGGTMGCGVVAIRVNRHFSRHGKLGPPEGRELGLVYTIRKAPADNGTLRRGTTSDERKGRPCWRFHCPAWWSNSQENIRSIVDATLRSKPKGMTQWSCRLMAARQGVSKSTINNIWQSHNLKPHRVKTFKLSRDAKFLEKLTDVVGLYLNPPQQAMVLCVDEKSQIQALDR